MHFAYLCHSASHRLEKAEVIASQWEKFLQMVLSKGAIP
jgi:hypothetical protein